MDLDYFVNDQHFQNVDITFDRKVEDAIFNYVKMFNVTTPNVGLTAPTQNFQIPTLLK